MRLVFSLVVVVGSFAALTAAVPTAPPPREAAAPSVETPFTESLLKVGAEYGKWGRVDDEYRWAPWLCRMPMPATAHASASKDADTHGQKLYSLFAKDRATYLAPAKDKPAAPGQVIVKQSWVPEESKAPTGEKGNDIVVTTIADPIKGPGLSLNGSDHFRPYVRKGDKWFKASKAAGLFVMMKLDPKTPETDEGWVYATLSADGRTVTAAGRIDSCMKCHQEKPGRLFGMPNQ